MKLMSLDLTATINATADEAELSILSPDGELLLGFKMDATGLEQWIAALGDVRARLTGDPVSEELEPNARVAAPVPVTYCGVAQPLDPIQARGGARAMLLRHPAFGWLQFNMSGPTAHHLAEQLTREAE